MTTGSGDSGGGEVLVATERGADGIAVLTLQREKARNALSEALRDALVAALAPLASDPAVRVIVVTGGPRVFAAGADLREMATMSAGAMQAKGAHPMWTALRACQKPLIAAVCGYAWGGGMELAMACDLIVAGRGASFAQPEIKVGVMPGGGGTQRLVRAVGKFQALRLLLTGAPVTGEEAFAMGLVSQVVADDEVLASARTLAAQIAALPPLAVRQIKAVVDAGADVALPAALTLERKAFELLFATDDQKEGMRAFLEKRAPTFTGA